MAGHKEQGSRRPGKQERKESRAAMAGRENGKGERDGKRKEKGKEVEGNKFGQQFCRLFLAPESGERLLINMDAPVQKLINKIQQINKKIVLIVRSAFEREKKNNSPLSLDRRISSMDRIPQAFSQYLLNQPIGLVSLQGQSDNTWHAELASDTEGLFFGHGWKEFVMDHSIESGHILTFSYDGCSQFSVVVFDGTCIEKPSAFHAKTSNDLVITIKSDEEDNEISASPQVEHNGTKNKRTEGPGASVGYKSASLNNTEDSDSSNRMLQESVHPKDSSKSSPMFRFSKHVDESGKTVVKFQRAPEVMSQRLPVSEGQKNYALQKAKQYKSKYPITLEIMKETNVYKSFFMIIPGEFVRKYLPHTDKKFTLWDPQGKAWEVTYVYCSERSAGAFSKGWGKFSLGNHLEKFDVCIFELFSEDNIKVHIYRANPALSPYIFDSNN